MTEGLISKEASLLLAYLTFLAKLVIVAPNISLVNVTWQNFVIGSVTDMDSLDPDWFYVRHLKWCKFH